MWAAPLGAFLASTALIVLAACLAPKQKLLAIAISAAGLIAIPWFAGSWPLVRGLAGLIDFVALMRVIDLVRERRAWPAWRRILHAISAVDSRLLRRAPRRFDARAFGAGLVWEALTAAGYLGLTHSATFWPRLACTLVLVYAAIEALYAVLRVSYAAAGFATPPLHTWPLASTTIGELWGVRWATPISRWLRDTWFRPLARRGHARLGLLAGFGWSALLHAYPTFVAIGLEGAAMMFGYFAVQGLVVLLEMQVGTAKWPRPVRRAWTIAIMLATSPLFLVPVLRAISSAD
jgi:hypothetical protein